MTREAVELTGDRTDERLDLFLARALGVTRSFAQRLLWEGRVSGAGKVKPSSRARAGIAYRVELPDPEGMELEPEPVTFRVVHEDEDLLVIDKPAGLVVHPAPGNWRGTLAHGLLWRYPEMRLLRNRLRPGIVHRLDATTSGLMIAARPNEGQRLAMRFTPGLVPVCAGGDIFSVPYRGDFITVRRQNLPLGLDGNAVNA